MNIHTDYTGQRFGKLTVIKRDGYKTYKNGRTDPVWLCKCDCGNYKRVPLRELRTRISCGCAKKTHTKALLYTVYNNETDELVALDKPAKECAKILGIALNSFYSMGTRYRQGKSKKWYIEIRDPRPEEFIGGKNEL